MENGRINFVYGWYGSELKIFRDKNYKKNYSQTWVKPPEVI